MYSLKHDLSDVSLSIVKGKFSKTDTMLNFLM